MINYVSGDWTTIPATHAARIDLAVSQNIFLPLIMDSGYVLVSRTINFYDSAWNS